MIGNDDAPLPQTEDRPSTKSPLFERHARLLFEAILLDDAERARPFFFPLEAYRQVKAIADPSRDWTTRLWRDFVRDIHTYHARLGPDPKAASLDHIDVREAAAKWMKPRSEGNRVGYYRVTRSTIRGRRSNGEPLSLELTSMISWRGEWYVVHLHGFD